MLRGVLSSLAEKATDGRFRVTLHGRVHRSFLVLLGLASAVGLSAFAAACASGQLSDSTPSDGGDDSTIDGASPEGGGEGGSAEGGGGTSLTQACSDNAAKYCAQLNTCSPFLLSTQYGDVVTCQTRLGGAYCSDIVTAKGSGWTGDGLEACVAARSKLSCTDFLYLRPAPAACRPTGTITSGSCLYDSQCGAGYCRIPGGMQCGNCVQRGNTGAPCTTSNDCDGNLVCLAAACAAPVPLGAACNATTPCQNGMVCLSGKCAQPGGVGATCSADAGGVDCDYALGAYCSGATCAAITVAMSASLCGGSSPPAVCYADGACQGGFCVPPVADGQPCDAGASCTIPSTCVAGTCGTPSAGQCP
jgi:hypothetical protein